MRLTCFGPWPMVNSVRISTQRSSCTMMRAIRWRLVKSAAATPVQKLFTSWKFSAFPNHLRYLRGSSADGTDWPPLISVAGEDQGRRLSLRPRRLPYLPQAEFNERPGQADGPGESRAPGLSSWPSGQHLLSTDTRWPGPWAPTRSGPWPPPVSAPACRRA